MFSKLFVAAPIVALAIDRLLFWIQRELFPYRYGGTGILHKGMQALLHVWEDFACALWRRPVQAPIAGSQPTVTPTQRHESKQS